MKFRFLALLLLVTALPAAAGRLIDKGVADGLGNRKVYQVCQDADGYIWFYTQSSIDRYDGFEFKHYLLGPEATEGNYTATASTLGLGAVWNASYPFFHAQTQEALGLPEDVIPFAVIPVGVEKGSEEPKDKWDPSKIHYNRW